MERGYHHVSFKRCAVIAVEGGAFLAYSPRNSQGHAIIGAGCVPGLIASIRGAVER